MRKVYEIIVGGSFEHPAFLKIEFRFKVIMIQFHDGDVCDCPAALLRDGMCGDWRHEPQ